MSPLKKKRKYYSRPAVRDGRTAPNLPMASPPLVVTHGTTWLCGAPSVQRLMLIAASERGFTLTLRCGVYFICNIAHYNAETQRRPLPFSEPDLSAALGATSSPQESPPCSCGVTTVSLGGLARNHGDNTSPLCLSAIRIVKHILSLYNGLIL